jgi:putative ABC transport system permease protein
METLWDETRFCLRGMAKSPGYVALAVLTLALGMGVATAVFSVVDAVVLRSLPYRDADRLVEVTLENPELGLRGERFAYASFLDFEREAGTLAEASAVSSGWNPLMETGEGPERISAHYASASLFSLLGVGPVLGRAFSPEEDGSNGNLVVVSHRFWRERLGAVQDLPGITLNGMAYQVIGVMPPSFRFLEDVDLWLLAEGGPLAAQSRDRRSVQIVARLSPGASVADASSELTALLRADAGTPPPFAAAVRPLKGAMESGARPALLLGAVGFVVLIGCANVATLLLGRGVARRKELAVRAAIGASGLRSALPLLIESVSLSLVAGAGGALMALWVVELIPYLDAPSLPRLHEVAVDTRVLGFSIVLALAAGVLTGLWPALQAIQTGFPWLGEGPSGARTVSTRRRSPSSTSKRKINSSAEWIPSARGYDT